MTASEVTPRALLRNTLTLKPEKDHMFQRLSVVLACLFLGTAVQADTTLTYEEGGQQSMLRIAAGKVRFDNGRDGNWLLFDTARREMTLVEPVRREYMVIDEARLNQLQATMDTVLATLQAQLADMPPAMREQMQQIMGGALPDPSGGGAVRLEATGRRGEAAGHECGYSRVVVNGEVQSEVCLAPASVLAIAVADQATVREWQKFARSMAERASAYVSVDAGVLGDDGQLPLIYRHPGSGRTGVLRDLSSAPVDSGLMRVPADFREGRLDMPLP